MRYLEAVPSAAVDEVGDGDDGVATAVGLTTSTKARVVPRSLDTTMSNFLSRDTVEKYLAGVGNALLEDMGLFAGDGGGNDERGQRTDEGNEYGEAGHCSVRWTLGYESYRGKQSRKEGGPSNPAFMLSVGAQTGASSIRPSA